MHAWSDVVKQLLRDEGGVTSIEYALIASLIAVTVLGAVASLGSSVSDLYQRIATKVAAALA
ncbi:Flp family type IVb pilin [Paraburkholderia sp. 22099]|mgnify:CR=1 FL=1|jgi:pilus assembly protein Flp/PilA|uniref:Pilus assembly protein Flp/PilA n=1 Tax=Paraburkholderia terricola TaxID=169427 RepID=A0A1M6NUY2_9BURK|nr:MULTISPECIES: Flp family type IVb pilin [Paraburkholderia]ORC51769.1 pilus assembly protein PilA [Burkholderia sp. A27]AXE95749.1 Flp family type IVb pilin [Paraburkholderia terricola]MDR6407250.1 pilus assembly protein Flp/PilA [Paraburkholderia terricola]MDR6445212.1 pilus assembly protein Flp/PilA [Paraburkholderia terricola]MDR6479072.1 pilus assembly protein Flp/PilA [Paraburkholderia terricola]